MLDQAVLQARIDAALANNSISHLTSFWLPVEVRIADVPHMVQIQVNFSNHCWTRSAEEADSPDDVLFIEKKKDGSIDERVFCIKRWAFSQQLPKLISNISHALCLPGRDKSVFYRLQSDASRGRDAGWYVCFKRDTSDSQRKITLSVRSSHYRTNKPDGTRGAPTRFWALFWDYYKPLRVKHIWMRDAEKKKAPL